MKTIVETLGKKNIIFKSLKHIEPKSLGTKKQIGIYLGTKLDNYYAIVLYVERKSRILSKDVEDYIALHHKVEGYNESKIYKKYIIIHAPLCSKAKAKLLEFGWRVFEI